MTLNNIRLSLRHLARQKLNTSLHIIGLTIGTSVCLLIGLFLRHELSFDTYHDKADRTYRINSVWTNSGKRNYHFATPLPLTNALRNSVSGMENISLAHAVRSSTIETSPQKRFMQDHILIAEPELLDIFNFEVLRGNAHEVLRTPYQALLTETTARKFFGNEDPIGKNFKYKNEFNITVGGLIRDLPPNTSLPASMILSYTPNGGYMGTGLDAWTYVNGTSTFVVLPDDYDLKTLEAQLKIIADAHINSNPHIPKFLRADFDIQALRDIHFDSRYGGGGEWVKAVNSSWLWFFASIGLAVLFLACINFINLSTAQALTRAKEVGVRKSVGAGRWQLIRQFLGEAWMLAFVAGVLAVAVAQVTLPAMNTLLEKEITFNFLQSPPLMLALFLGILLTGLLAGLYPAWAISKFNPAVTLKSGSALGGDDGSSWLRKCLVVAQFTISAGLLISVSLIAQQVKFMREKSLGFDKDNILNVEVSNPGLGIFATGLTQIPQVKDFSFATATPSSNDHWGTIMSKTNSDDPNRQEVTPILADNHFCIMYGLQLLSGRFPMASDTNFVSASIPERERIAKVIVNQELVEALDLGTPEKAIGQRFWFGMGSGNAEIVGVVADFNTGSLHEAIRPTLITQNADGYGQAGIKIEAGSDLSLAIANIETAWRTAFPEGVFDFKFLDAQIDSFYKAEARLYSLFKIFAGLAMLISCLGLWGLAAFTAQQRTKEIGIRKVLGASANAIVVLLSKDFIFMVLVALAISSPIAYYMITDWLQHFAFHIDISWEVFVMVGVGSLLVALATVIVQTLQAAWTDPAQVLKNE